MSSGIGAWRQKLPQINFMEWFEKKVSDEKADVTFGNYSQKFGEPRFIYRAPWYQCLWFEIRTLVGITWLQRKVGKPHPWDEKSW